MNNVEIDKNVVKRLSDSTDLVDIMIGIEDYLDRSNIYVFKNWIDGELVDGPYVEPYWIKVVFKWNYKDMPDPEGGTRLLPHGTKIFYKKDKEMVPQPIKEPSDYEPGTHKPKLKAEKIWLVTLLIPRRFIENINDEVLDLYSSKTNDDELENLITEPQPNSQTQGNSNEF